MIAARHDRVAVIEVEAEIRRSSEDAFDYASDPTAGPHWR
jgi:hypothetical protein